MKLKVHASNAPTIVPIGMAVTLSSNGLAVRVYDTTLFDLVCQLDRPEVQFHTDDAKTVIEINGYCDPHDARNKPESMARRISLTLT
jgi:hypothetical protein